MVYDKARNLSHNTTCRKPSHKTVSGGISAQKGERRMKYRLVLCSVTWINTEEQIDFEFQTLEECFEKAKFFLDQGYTIELQNIVEDE